MHKTLTDAQRVKHNQIRNQDVHPKGAYLYSEPIEMLAIIETDFLFK